MNCNFIFMLLLTLSFALNGQIQSPGVFLGYELGTHFSLHHQVVDYYKHLEKNSSNVKLVSYGKTNEGRSLQLVFISTSENLENIEAIRTAHLQNSGTVTGPKNENKSIVWLSYNVHGNESSSTEASMKTAYNLLTKYQEWLADTIVIIDPCINPDGRDRYVNFYKQTRSMPNNTNRNAREHHEPWHSGRTNHYIFDLNRDWAWLTQVESQQRIKQYNRWLPHIHVDFHEQDINSPYYFAPAVEPLHEMVTDFQKDFQDAIGKNHAKYFDKKGWLYFTKQRFDLLYPSYGDTYPMFLGSIGMTYEQAGGGIAGLGIENDENIMLTLKDRIEHHYTTGISTVEMASKNRIQLNKNYQAFYNNENLKYKNFVLEGNQDRINALVEFFKKHEIVCRGLSKNRSIYGFDYQKQKKSKTSFSKDALVIPTNQIKGKLVQILLEPKTKLNDSLTYDITAWSLAYAYSLKAIATYENINTVPYSSLKHQEVLIDTDTYGFAFSYNSFEDSKFLAALIKEKIAVRYNTLPLNNSGKNWESGSLFILKGDNLKNENYIEQVEKLARKHKRKIHQISTGYSEKGPDLGADELKLIKAPRIALFRSDNSYSYNYGEIWHFFEQDLKYPLFQVDKEKLLNILSDIDLLIIPEGHYKKWSNSKEEKKIQEWLSKGGKIIAVSSALNIFANSETFGLKKKENPNQDTTKVPYNKLERSEISKITTGSIFEASIDKFHPLSFGIDRYFTLKLDAESYELLEDEGNVFILNEKVKSVSGFVGYLAKENQKNSLLLGQERFGNGYIVYFVDNLLFRGFWYTGKQVFSNAIFF